LTHWQSARFDPTEMERAAFAGSGDWPRAQTHRLEVFHRAKGGQRRRVLMVLWAPHRQLIERFVRGPWERDLIALANSVMEQSIVSPAKQMAPSWQRRPNLNTGPDGAKIFL
jgi:hypothetical protein